MKLLRKRKKGPKCWSESDAPNEQFYIDRDGQLPLHMRSEGLPLIGGRYARGK